MQTVDNIADVTDSSAEIEAETILVKRSGRMNSIHDMTRIIWAVIWAVLDLWYYYYYY